MVSGLPVRNRLDVLSIVLDMDNAFGMPASVSKDGKVLHVQSIHVNAIVLEMEIACMGNASASKAGLVEIVLKILVTIVLRTGNVFSENAFAILDILD